jgi:hypothetical protein
MVIEGIVEYDRKEAVEAFDPLELLKGRKKEVDS